MSVLVIAAVVRRGNEVLLVKQQGPDDPAPNWALPAGRVEQGESLSQALAREVLEETGLQVVRPGALRSVSHAMDTVSGNDYLALTFDHRVVDGARAAEFGLAVLRRLQAPAGT